jgi:hypothetical protein
MNHLYDSDPPEERITRPIHAPLCIAIDAPKGDILRWAACASEVGLLIRAMKLDAAMALVPAWEPVAVIVARATLERHGEAIRRAVGAARSRLVVVPDDGKGLVSLLRARLKTRRQAA